MLIGGIICFIFTFHDGICSSLGFDGYLGSEFEQILE